LGILKKAGRKLAETVGLAPKPVTEDQIKEYILACQEALIQLMQRDYKQGGLLPVEQRFLAEALPAYFTDSVQMFNAIRRQDLDVEMGYLRLHKAFWKEWDEVFAEIPAQRQIKTSDPMSWGRAWQTQLLILKIFSDLDHFQRIRGLSPEQAYVLEARIFDLPRRLVEIAKQESLDLPLPGKKH